MDETELALHPPMNKGREAMAYLSYIIDNYHKLALTIAFIHPHQGGWPAAYPAHRRTRPQQFGLFKLVET